MKKIFEELQNCMDSKKAAVLVTVTDSKGSTPRGAGSRMLVTEDGICCGTIGGGAVEYQAFKTALGVLESGSSRFEGFTLTRNQTADIGMVCGGNVRVYFQYVSPEDPAMRELCPRILSALEEDQDSWLLMDLTDEGSWKMGLYQEGKLYGLRLSQEAERQLSCLGTKAGEGMLDGHIYYSEPLVQAGTVYIFGGGHVAQELVPLLSHLNFRCVVMDDREEFANSRVFPTAKKTIVGNLQHLSDFVRITDRDYVCIMTRGHQYDYYVQKQVLPIKPCYIGIMGSRNKIRVTTEKLLADGFSLEEIQFCHMPIGTRIQAQTPAEIAVSIAGELISVRASF